jgi:carbon storage regulator
MLVLTRKPNQAIVIGDDIRVVVVSVDRDQVRLGIEAPREVTVHRAEVYEEIQRGLGELAGARDRPDARPWALAQEEIPGGRAADREHDNDEEPDPRRRR